MQNMDTEKREEDVEDDDYAEKVPDDTVLKPLQDMKANEPLTHRDQPSTLLPVPPTAQQSFNGPSDQFMAPTLVVNIHGNAASEANVQLSFPNSQFGVNQQWVLYWQMVFYNFWNTYNVGRTLGSSGGAYQQPQQQNVPVNVPARSNYDNKPQQAWNSGFSGNPSSGNAPMSRERTAYGYADSANAYTGRNEVGANAPGVNFARSNQYQLNEHQQRTYQQAPRLGNSYSNRGNAYNGQMKPGNSARTGNNFYNPHQMQSYGNGPNAGFGGRQSGNAQKMQPSFEQDFPQEHKNSSSVGATGDATDEWFEFDSTDLRPSRGSAKQTRGRGGFGPNKGGGPSQRGRGGGGYIQRPPMQSANYGNKNSKNFY